MPAPHEIRADFDAHTIVVYQAFSPAIADAALAAGRFAPPFSLGRMTWIKPSFLWLMERSGWGRKPNQERTLAVRITQSGWLQALSQAALTSFTPGVHASVADWEASLAEASVRVQWDPERSLRGAKLLHRSIQVGLSRQIVAEYVNQWTVEIKDLSPVVAKLNALRSAGRYDQAARLLPPERVFPVGPEIARRLGM